MSVRGKCTLRRDRRCPMRIAIVCQLCAIVATMNAPHRALHSARGVVFGRAGWRRSHAGGELAVAVWPSRLAACGVASCSAVAFGCGDWPRRLARRGVGTSAVAVGRGGLTQSVGGMRRGVVFGRGVWLWRLAVAIGPEGGGHVGRGGWPWRFGRVGLPRRSACRAWPRRGRGVGRERRARFAGNEHQETRCRADRQ